MTDDIVAELDRWRRTPRTAENAHEFVPIAELLQRARDEIVALRAENREMRRTFGSHPLFKEARAEVLEEAAHECDEEAKASSEGFRDGCETCAAAIRALKER